MLTGLLEGQKWLDKIMTDKIDIIMCSAELTKNTERFAINNANTN